MIYDNETFFICVRWHISAAKFKVNLKASQRFSLFLFVVAEMVDT